MSTTTGWGVWGYVLAPSAEAIRERFPELEVFSEEPEWLTDAEPDIEDLDEPQRLGLLGAMLAQRENDQREVDQ